MFGISSKHLENGKYSGLGFLPSIGKKFTKSSGFAELGFFYAVFLKNEIHAF